MASNGARLHQPDANCHDPTAKGTSMIRTGMKTTRALATLLCGLVLPLQPVHAQGLNTAAMVRPILEMTKANWIAVREWEGQDLLYFTQLLPFRCGLHKILYGINDAPAKTAFNAEPCPPEAEGEMFATIEAENYLPYLTFELGSIERVTVTLVYDDGVRDTVEFQRADVMTP